MYYRRRSLQNKYKNIVYNKVKLPLAHVAIARVSSSLRHNRKEEESKMLVHILFLAKAERSILNSTRGLISKRNKLLTSLEVK